MGRTANMKSSHNSCSNERQPDKGAEHDSGNAGITRSPAPWALVVTPQSSDGDPGCEPKDHGDGLDACDGVFVCGGWEARWGEDEIGDSEEGPDGGEEHEVHAVGGPGAPWTGVGVDDICCETQDDEREDGLDGTEGENESSHVED